MTDAPAATPASPWHTAWPRVGDPAAADRLIERFVEIGEEAAEFAASPAGAAVLRSIGGHSVYLSDLAVREHGAFVRLAESGPDALVADALAELAATSPAAPRRDIAAALRRAKRLVAMGTAIADLGDVWGLEQVTGALSDLAQSALTLAVSHLARALHDNHIITLPDPETPSGACGLTVLGMGKLGARELNYSSDVDLVVLFDPDAVRYDATGDSGAISATYARMTRDLVALMEARDADGYVFRTDLRLRPDPAATPPAIALTAAITYYESMGQNWERAAMVKARPVAGDHAIGVRFLQEIRPFIWRRHLDFAAIADIGAMKRRIDAHHGRPLGSDADPLAAIAGHNVKLGIGGIREIEFTAQTLQLVWGGRDPGLRSPSTLGALRLLAASGHLPATAAAELASAYGFFRRVEHRLQMVADRQIHTLPERRSDLERFARFAGFEDGDTFARTVLVHLRRVQAHFDALFAAAPSRPADGADEAFATAENDAEVAEFVAGLGYANAAAIASSIRGWRSGRARALRSERARQLLEGMLPRTLRALARQPQPDVAFARFDRLMLELPAGVQVLSLFQRNPLLLDRVAAILGAASPLAEHLARSPAALDGLLATDIAADPAGLLASRLADARLFEEAIAIVRRTVREEDFAIAVATLEGRIDADAAGLARTALADAALSQLLPRVLADFASRNGSVPGGAMVVVVLGKAGSREMMAGSDLDLMLIYDHPETVTETQPAPGSVRRMPASQWFVRAAHAFVAAVTAPGADGPLYSVDMRLRPSGNKGPVAVSLAAFNRYHAESAWTWERMALTRARVVAGPWPLTLRVSAAIEAAVASSGDPAKVCRDAAAMRARMQRELPPDGPWDVKHRVGGQIDVEFAAQVGQLLHARAHPEVRSPTTGIALDRLAKAGLFERDHADLLIRADRLWRTVQGMLRLTLGRSVGDSLPDAAARALLRAVAPDLGAVDLPALRATMDDVARAVRGALIRIVGEIKE